MSRKNDIHHEGKKKGKTSVSPACGGAGLWLRRYVLQQEGCFYQ